MSALESSKLEIAAADERHMADMQLADAKIRKALSAKDKTIMELEQKLKSCERKLKDAENLIEDLNNGFSMT